jgi:hypothetical protein
MSNRVLLDDGLTGAHSSLDVIATCHSSHGGAFGERVGLVKDAIGRSEEHPLQATGYGTASQARAIHGL